MAQQTEGRTGFLSLSPELRNHIYYYCLTVGSITVIRQRGKAAVHRSIKKRLTPGLLATCRTINSEATPILYGANKFDFMQRTASEFLAGMGSGLTHVRHVILGFVPDVALTSTLSSLLSCRHLQRVELPFIYIERLTAEKVAKLLGPFLKGMHENSDRAEEKSGMEVIV